MAPKPDKRRNTDETRLTEVEDGLAAASPLPEAVLAEIGEVELSGDEGGAARLQLAWRQVKQREAALAKARTRNDEEAEKLSVARKELAAEREAVVTERASLEDRLALVEERERAMAEEDRELEVKRSEARTGFATDSRQITQTAAAARDSLVEEMAHLEAQARKRASEAVADVRAELDSEREALARERRSLEKQAVGLREREAQVEGDRAFAKERGRVLAEQFERQLEERVSLVTSELEDARELLSLERSRAARTREELVALRNRLSLFDDSPETLTEQMNALRADLAAAESELSRRPAASEVEALRGRLKNAEDVAADARHWQQRHDEVSRQLTYQLIHVGEVEVLRDERDALRSQRETLRQSIAQHRQDWEELQTNESALVPFPACSAYDNDRRLSTRADLREIGTLSDLVTEVRDRMATQSDTAYFYSEPDVRIFLAGLASSRLHLLQGISGTGKTSLPREFFRALGGGEAADVIEVQAGWRDKDDLFGYYNAFEKRFVESEFTKALYRALVTANRDRPMVIVLDEMNLAHPEQYFGSMLSILENSVSEQGHLALLTSEIPGVPQHFNGSRLPLPRNVWFVGTANHDETTVAFADKTYDRAHVQELPSSHDSFSAASRAEDPISYRSLVRAFDSARRTHAREVNLAWRFLTETLAPRLEPFGVGWGNRLQRQVESFVPVVLEADGSMTEAVDHLVATKVVRKLEDRFGVRPEDLDQLADDVDQLWRSLDKAPPQRTLSRICREAVRLRGGFST